MNKEDIKILILEDNDERIECFKNIMQGTQLTIVKHVSEAVEHLQNTSFDLLCLDHDLDGKAYVTPEQGEQTGTDVARFLSVNPQFKPKHVILHSLNEPGRKIMLSYLPEAEEVPFLWLKKIQFHI